MNYPNWGLLRYPTTTFVDWWGDEIALGFVGLAEMGNEGIKFGLPIKTASVHALFCRKETSIGVTVLLICWIRGSIS